MRRVRSTIAAKGDDGEVAMVSKPGGMASTRSPWLIQTSSRLGSPSKSSLPGFASMVAGPYSRCAEASTRPPSSCERSWWP
jgi:hypothetical protein